MIKEIWNQNISEWNWNLVVTSCQCSWPQLHWW